MTLDNMSQAEEFLFSTVPKTSADAFKGERALEKSRRFFDALGSPQNARPAIHIAATSGKGTIAHMAESILVSHDMSVLTITSPHVYTVRERIRLNGEIVSEAEFLETLNALMATYLEFSAAGNPPSYFEVNVGVGFLLAKKHQVDYVVVETGLGGLLDTTNTIDRSDKINILGQIGFDHMNILGNTLEQIAAQKAGIIGEGQDTLALRQEQSVMDVFAAAALEKNAKLSFASPDGAASSYPNLGTLNESLFGAHQYANLCLALGALEIAAKRDGWGIKSSQVETAIKSVSLPGRFEVVHVAEKTYIFDGAHNRQKLDAVFDAMSQTFGHEPYGIVFASGQHEEQASELARLIRGKSKDIIFTEYHSQALDMYKPSYDFTASANGHMVEKNPESVAGRVWKSDVDVWLITGTFYVLADIRKALENTG